MLGCNLNVSKGTAQAVLFFYKYNYYKQHGIYFMKQKQLDEVFDENTKTYQVNNLKPSLKLPQVWQFSVPGNDRLAARMVSFLSDGDSVKNVKMGDKFVQVFLMSLSEKGNPGELKGGLGSDPIGAITTIFDTVYEQAKKYKFDAVLFRLPIKKMKGQANAVQKVMSRLATQRTGGKFVVLKELWGHSAKYAYVLIKRKNINLEDIKGIPNISSELYDSEETKAGTIFKDKKTGNPVTKDEAIAATIAKVEDSRTTDRAIAAKTKISRRAFISSQYADIIINTSTWESDHVRRREEFNDNPPVFSSDNKNKIKNFDEVGKHAANMIKDIVEIGLEDGEKIGNEGEYVYDDVMQLYKHIYNNIKARNKSFKNDEDIKIQAKEHLLNYYRIIEKYDGNNMMSVLENLSKFLLETFSDIDIENRSEMIRSYMRHFMDLCIPHLETGYVEMTTNNKSTQKFDMAERASIKAYCGHSFDKINRYLIGLTPADETTRDVLIPNLDKAFSKGSTLPDEATLYRGMQLTRPILTRSIDSKMFYFTNYVSTSLSPWVILDSAVMLDKKQDRISANDADSEDIVKKYGDTPQIKAGLIISGANKIKVIVPGNLSNYTDECEIILPRGTVLEFNTIYSKSKELQNTDNRAILIECNIVAPELIDENTIMYDGDALINEGTVKRFDFIRFNEGEEIDNKKTKIVSTQSMDVLIDMLDIDNTPPKFK